MSPPGSQDNAATVADLTDRFSPVVRRSSWRRAPPDKFGDWVHAHRVENEGEVFV